MKKILSIAASVGVLVFGLGYQVNACVPSGVQAKVSEEKKVESVDSVLELNSVTEEKSLIAIDQDGNDINRDLFDPLTLISFGFETGTIDDPKLFENLILENIKPEERFTLDTTIYINDDSFEEGDLFQMSVMSKANSEFTLIFFDEDGTFQSFNTKTNSYGEDYTSRRIDENLKKGSYLVMVLLGDGTYTFSYFKVL